MAIVKPAGWRSVYPVIGQCRLNLLYPADFRCRFNLSAACRDIVIFKQQHDSGTCIARWLHYTYAWLFKTGRLGLSLCMSAHRRLTCFAGEAMAWHNQPAVRHLFALHDNVLQPTPGTTK
ncbi:hypothetical protein [Sphingorhabdus sp. YGSMI21]|uniref:hypothetical protein n=1 Tax=Sphingorhabdus sp. YGSMI21 TaxID=2077182 RepID=UPI000F4EA51C|nr:hypothetical protein [Sphingorhabdus sp. YGSMI21]